MKNKEEKPSWIYKDIVSSMGADEKSKVYLSTNMETGESELIIEKTIVERYPTKDYEKVMDLHERLTCGGGRKSFTLNELAHK